MILGTALPSLAGANAGPHPPYPPAAVGLRGSRPDDLAAAHAVRDGLRYRLDDYPVTETVDSLIVGAGLGGLTAAHCLHRAQPRARLLILDNHDDFGGHARRNEFDVDGRRLIGYGGSESIQSPYTEWPSQASQVLGELGISVDRLAGALDGNLYPGLGLSSGVLFKRETFGADKLVTGDPQRSLPTDVPADKHRGRAIPDFVADLPVAADQKARLVALYESRTDLLAGMSRSQKLHLLAHTSYLDYLRQYWGLDATSLEIFRGRTCDLFGSPADTIPARDCADCEYPGFAGLDLGRAGDYSYEREPYVYHFPDGNAGIARMFVRELIPDAAPGRTMDDIVLAPFDYGRLDAPGNPVRLRLSSTVVQLRHHGRDGVDVLYVNGGSVQFTRWFPARQTLSTNKHPRSRCSLPSTAGVKADSTGVLDARDDAAVHLS